MIMTTMMKISVGITIVVVVVLSCCQSSLFKRLIGGNDDVGINVGVDTLGGNADVGISSADDISVTSSLLLLLCATVYALTAPPTISHTLSVLGVG